MPVYVYRCDDCGAKVEKRQSFSDAPLTTCEVCGGGLRKLLVPPVVIFKGPGFYSTDHRAGSATNGQNGDSEKTESTKPESGDAAKKDQPAKSEASSEVKASKSADG